MKWCMQLISHIANTKSQGFYWSLLNRRLWLVLFRHSKRKILITSNIWKVVEFFNKFWPNKTQRLSNRTSMLINSQWNFCSRMKIVQYLPNYYLNFSVSIQSRKTPHNMSTSSQYLSTEINRNFRYYMSTLTIGENKSLL